MRTLLAAAIVALTLRPARALDAAAIEKATGLRGSMDASGKIFKVEKPRSDIALKVAGVDIKPPQGLTSWAAFEGEGRATMVMGDVVLTEPEVDPAMSAALDNGLAVTALHNHFLFESPRVMFMHVSGMGDEAALAKAVGAVMAAGAGKPPAEEPLKAGDLDAAKLQAVLGEKGDSKDGKIYKFVFEKRTTVDGRPMGKAMGVNTWAAFAGGDADAVVDGDFAMLEPELQDVLKALRRGGLSVVAIHQHMTMDKPRVLFLHFWGRGRAADLAKAIAAARATQKG